MTERRVEIYPGCSLVATEWTYHSDVALEYVERSPDPWYSDTVTSVDIDREMAARIVEFLRREFCLP